MQKQRNWLHYFVEIRLYNFHVAVPDENILRFYFANIIFIIKKCSRVDIRGNISAKVICYRL